VGAHLGCTTRVEFFFAMDKSLCEKYVYECLVEVR
jgi:hypothetical protein